jgi:hypothetical protein
MGINILALMASFLDPSMKGGVGISDTDKEIIYDTIRESIIDIAAVEIGNQCEQQQQQQQQPEQMLALHKNQTATYYRRGHI